MPKPRLMAVGRPNRLAMLLAVLVVVLAVGHVGVWGVRKVFNLYDHDMLGLFRFFNMGTEANLPTYVSALMLLLAGGLFGGIARHHADDNRFTWYWWVLAFGFVFMSFDEATQIHEGVVERMLHELGGLGAGTWHYTWYIFFIPLVVVIGLAYIPFLWHLRRRYALRFIAAGCVFLSGAIGVEIIEAYNRHQVAQGAEGGMRGLTFLVEETLEMLGTVLLIHTLLLYMAEHHITLSLRVTTASSPEPGEAPEASRE